MPSCFYLSPSSTPFAHNKVWKLAKIKAGIRNNSPKSHSCMKMKPHLLFERLIEHFLKNLNCISFMWSWMQNATNATMKPWQPRHDATYIYIYIYTLHHWRKPPRPYRKMDPWPESRWSTRWVGEENIVD